MTLMLSSVRDAREAGVALAGGSDWIDVKDPRIGALGAAEPGIIREVVALVGGAVPVSATTGDAWDDPTGISAGVRRVAGLGLDYVKVGVRLDRHPAEVLEALRGAARGGASLIAVCMAETAPDAQVVDALAACGVSGVMIDTAEKGGPALPALLDAEGIRAFTARAREQGLICGLAGRLALADVPALAGCGADYLGFRSALCAAGRRETGIDPAAFAAVRAAMSRTSGRTATRQTTSSEVA